MQTHDKEHLDILNSHLNKTKEKNHGEEINIPVNIEITDDDDFKINATIGTHNL